MKKKIALFILCIFIGVSIAPSITGNIKQISKNSVLNVDGVLTKRINYDNDNNAPSLLDINTGLVGYWSFDFENAEDESGNNNHGTSYGAVAVAGISGNALDFDGVNDQVVVPDAPCLSFHEKNQFSISLWIKSDTNLVLDSEYLISKGTGSTDTGYCVDLGHPTSTLGFCVMDGSTKNWCRSNTIINDGEWYHIVAVWDGTTQYLYINGELDSSVDLEEITIADDFKDIQFGNHWLEHWYHGIIDEIRIYDRALTKGEIQNLFNNPSGMKTTIFMGEITNLNSDFGNIITFEAENLRIIQFSPFQVLKYFSDEKIKISEDYLGIITPKFAFGIFKAII